MIYIIIFILLGISILINWIALLRKKCKKEITGYYLVIMEILKIIILSLFVTLYLQS